MAIKYNHSFSKIDKILPKTAQQYKLQETMVKHQVLRFWEEAACAFVSEAKQLSKAVHFERGVLVVACLSNKLAKEIKIFASHIINAINQLIGRVVVHTLEIET